jgi:ATP-dependent Clp protease ATP-binding subunit ClpA/CheY-like chemotaxis protein
MTDRTKIPPANRGRRNGGSGDDLAALLGSKVVGQSAAIEAIVPSIEMFQAGLAPENRPAGVFLLLGPTGTGKTRTVEALAEALHGSVRNVLKIDCGEFQMEHEVAKLIGAPPGYLGHRETTPLLSQQKLTGVTSDDCSLAIVLFDEIEKAAPSLARLLLGVLDRGILRLGDNTSVDFEKSLVFLTSNLGAKEMMRAMSPQFGFHSAAASMTAEDIRRKLGAIGLGAVKRKFSPEFVNRIDHIITFRPLDAESLAAITDLEIRHLQRHISERLGMRAFELEVPFPTRQWLIEKGTSQAYGARELKRTIHRHLTQPLAARVARMQVSPGSRVRAEVEADRQSLSLRMAGAGEAPAPAHPTLLVAEPNHELLEFLECTIAEAGWDPILAQTTAAAKKLAVKRRPNAALIDLDLPEAGGIVLGLQLRQTLPDIQVTLMTGPSMDREEEHLCADQGFAVVKKPFLVPEILAEIRRKLLEAA